MKLFKMVWEWIVGVVRLFRRGNLWVALAGVVILAGCGSGEILDRGFVGDVSAPGGFGLGGLSTTLKKDTEEHLGYYRGGNGEVREMFATYRNGQGVVATGIAAIVETCKANSDCIWAALGQPADPPPELLAAPLNLDDLSFEHLIPN